MIDRLRKELRPERRAEEAVLEAAAALPNADLLVDMVERSKRREFAEGAEIGRREVYDEIGATGRTQGIAGDDGHAPGGVRLVGRAGLEPATQGL